MSFAAPPPPPPAAMGGGAGIATAAPLPLIPTAAAKRPLQLLLTNVPECLRGSRQLRGWLQAGSGGGVRSVVLIPQSQQPSQSQAAQSSSSSSNPAAEEQDAAGPNVQPNSVTALVTLAHADAALKVLTAFRRFQQKLREAASDDDDESSSNKFSKFAAHAVPGDPDVPLPPAVMDRETVTVLGDKLYGAFRQFERGRQDAVGGTAATNNSAAAAAAATSTGNENRSATATTATAGNLQAAAGGGDDGDDDPLESPAIQEAVRQFRAQLQLQQGSKATRRQQLVREAISKALPVVRQRVRQERASAGSTLR